MVLNDGNVLPSLKFSLSNSPGHASRGRIRKKTLEGLHLQAEGLDGDVALVLLGKDREHRQERDGQIERADVLSVVLQFRLSEVNQPGERIDLPT